MDTPWDAVAAAAKGDRSGYRLDPAPIDGGGQADVFRAIHKATGQEVALKRLRGSSVDAVARMRREIEVCRELSNIKHVMPVLDASLDHDWYVMPLAHATAEERRDSLGGSEERLRRMIESVCAGLVPAHERGWVHRDVKPANILWLTDGAVGRWVLGDWGLGRRPPGQTSAPGRTRTGVSYGTEGFAAPELAGSAHAATPAADIWSLGQVLGALVTGSDPRANVALVPPSGPWRAVVRAATHFEPEQRPQTIAEFRDLIADELDEPDRDIFGAAEQLLDRSKRGDTDAATELLRLAAANPEDDDLHIDVLPALPREVARGAVRSEPRAAVAVVDTLRTFDGDWGYRDFKWADEVIKFLHEVAVAAAQLPDLPLLESACDALFEWDGAWDQWSPQPAIRKWLTGLSGESARSVAAALRRHPDSARHFEDVGDDRKANESIRASIKRSP